MKKISVVLVSLIMILGLKTAYSSTNDFSLVESIIKLAKPNATNIETMDIDSVENAPFDLKIQSVELKKISGPGESFNYYKYYATVVIHNRGGYAENLKVLLSDSSSDSYLVLDNGSGGLTLNSNQSFVVREYEILLDSNYNGRNIEFELLIDGADDLNTDNNRYEICLFEDQAKIKDIRIDQIFEDGTLSLSFDAGNYFLKAHDFELLMSKNPVVKLNGGQYMESFSSDQIYEYFRVENSKEKIKSVYKSQKLSNPVAGKIRINHKFLGDKNDYYVFLKATDPKSGNFVVSDILKLNPAMTLTRQEFAKKFIEDAGIEIYDAGELRYDDVVIDSKYAPYIQTLFNLGLLNFEKTFFYPEDEITRAEVLRIMMDFFDIDLSILEGAPHFADVREDHYLYPYSEGLFASGYSKAFSGSFYPEESATDHFVNYLIHVFKKSN